MSAVFSMPKNKVRQSFASAADTYDGFAVLQRQVGLDFISMFEISIAGQSVMDLGCGTGFLIQELMAADVAQKMLAVDIAYSMLQTSRSKSKCFNTVQYICADAEKLPLVDDSLDTIVSNLALQWCQDLTGVFQGFKRVLRTDGRLFFSTFGTKTLQELKQSWAEVDRYTHVNEFSTVDQLKFFLTQASFKNIHINKQCYCLNYPSVLALMKELKGIGANQVISGRNKKITARLQMQAMINTYERYQSNGLIPATYEVLFVSATV